jgi:hypothetical protein
LSMPSTSTSRFSPSFRPSEGILSLNCCCAIVEAEAVRKTCGKLATRRCCARRTRQLRYALVIWGDRIRVGSGHSKLVVELASYCYSAPHADQSIGLSAPPKTKYTMHTPLGVGTSGSRVFLLQIPLAWLVINFHEKTNSHIIALPTRSPSRDF